MSRNLDAIIFGASSYTGQFVIEEALEILKDFRWGIAGRNEKKLKRMLSDIEAKIKKDLTHVPIIIADVNDTSSLEIMAKQCRIVLNCCGPYNILGEPVVKACIDAGTHHVDITGEPQFIGNMLLKYNDLAKEKGVYIVYACGLESVPAELGVLFAEEHFGERQLNKEKLPPTKPKLWLKPFPHQIEASDRYYCYFPATDKFVIERSQRYFYDSQKKRPIQFESYIGFRSFWLALLWPFYVILLLILSQFTWSRKALLRSPHLFSFGLVSAEKPLQSVQNSIEFAMTLKAKGRYHEVPDFVEPKKELVVRVSGKNPIYGVTSNAMLICAKTILNESSKMPQKGGVLSPASAFAKTQIIEEITRTKYGLKFDVIKT
uniref:Saccharopine dehydrogenase NADP binding domain-containing protein n=1 Tax=Glossina palpalis gambiensis TaxID=67801 RepID=A0A1B0B7A7_9MUSC